MLLQLLQPFNYLRIKHSQKILVDLFVPLVLTAISVAAIFYCTPQINLYGDKGLVQTLTQFVQTLPGFYVAALAAIVTFSNDRMDELMPGVPPTLNEKLSGVNNDIKLTRRRFLSLMFAFLTAESIIVVLFGIALTVFAPEVKELISCSYKVSVSIVGLSIYTFLCIQMAVITFWGLYYLGTRIHSVE